MPTYWYDCPDHGNELRLKGEQKPPETIPCKWCPRTARRVVQRFGVVQITPDIPEHWNLSLDQPVRSRRHLRDVQKRTGTQDYEGYRGASLHHVFGPGGELRRVKHSDVVRR